MTVETDQKYHKTVEADANIFCQMKQRADRLAFAIIHFYIKKIHGGLDIQAVGGVVYVSSYPLLESMHFYAGISGGFSKMRASTILGDILRPHQCTKNPLNYVNTKSKYGHFVTMPVSTSHEPFSRAARDKVWVEKFCSIHQV